jgi:RNA polymerase sigma factor (sigma-70 family)
MNPSAYQEEEFKRILDDYSKHMHIQVQRYNLLKYGLDPEDILQDVRIRLWKLICANRKILSPPAYIKKIVSSAVIDQLRKRRRDEDLYHREKMRWVSEEGFPYSWEAARKKSFEEVLGKAVDRLISSRRQVVKLYLLDLSIPEISSYLNWSHDKTRNLLYRGLADLKEYLKAMEDKHEDRS